MIPIDKYHINIYFSLSFIDTPNIRLVLFRHLTEIFFLVRNSRDSETSTVPEIRRKRRIKESIRRIETRFTYGNVDEGKENNGKTTFTVNIKH